MSKKIDEALPIEDYMFLKWENGDERDLRILTVTKDLDLTATFTMDPDGIEPVNSSEYMVPSEESVYNLAGQQIVNGKSSNGKWPKGINIIRMSDGTTRKVIRR